MHCFTVVPISCLTSGCCSLQLPGLCSSKQCVSLPYLPFSALPSIYINCLEGYLLFPYISNNMSVKFSKLPFHLCVSIGFLWFCLQMFFLLPFSLLVMFCPWYSHHSSGEPLLYKVSFLYARAFSSIHCTIKGLLPIS